MSAKKKAAKTKRHSVGKQAPVEVVLEQLVRAVVAAHPSDPSRPGVLLSMMVSGEWYGSVLRYKESCGAEKFVVCNARAATMREVVEELSRRWLGTSTARRRLAKALNEEDLFDGYAGHGMDAYGVIPD